MIHPQLPDYDYSLVIRTDFSDDAAWEQLCQAIQAPQVQAGFTQGFEAAVECISDISCSELQPEEVASVLPEASQRAFVFLVDSVTLSHPEHPLLVVDLEVEPGRSFRVIPSEVWSVENNLRLANMEFEEFAERVNADGVFRGVPRGSR